VLTVRVLSPRPGGGHAMLSYPGTFAKGRLAAALVTLAAADPQHPERRRCPCGMAVVRRRG